MKDFLNPFEGQKIFSNWYFEVSLIFWDVFSEYYLWKSPRTRELRRQRVRGAKVTWVISSFFSVKVKKGVKLRWLWWWVRPKAKNSNRPSHDERADSEEMDKSYWAVSFKSPKRLDQWARRIVTPQQKGRHAEEFQPNRQPILSQRQTKARPNFTQSKPTKKIIFRTVLRK